MRTFAIGDIHGCRRALDALLGALALSPDDRLVFLGDYVDRGPDSAGVMDRVIELAAGGQAVCLLGNHEEMLLDAQAGGRDYEFWVQVGGAAALKSYEERYGTAEVPDAHLRFLAEGCVPFFEDEAFLYVHATCLPELTLPQQPAQALRWIRFSDPPPHRSGKTLVAGHTAQRSGLPRDLGHAVCIDTWAYGAGWLTALDTTGGRFLQANEAGEVRSFARGSQP